MRSGVPLIDVEPLVTGRGDVADVARRVGEACRDLGFFYIENHGVDARLQAALEDASRRFFALDLAEKMTIAMANGGRAWRGFFPVGDELTSGSPDLKEGLYFGSELDDAHPDVRAGLPLHGANLFPAAIPELRALVLDYIAALTRLGHALMRGLSLSLGLDPSYLDERMTRDPLILFRIFNYPAPREATERAQWGVGEHTDYGVLTILKQDDCGGLEVKTPSGDWIDAPPIANTFVCNIGDMLDRMTGGLYRSTPHRVRNASNRDRLSWPFFFDPGFHVTVHKLPVAVPAHANAARWDNDDVPRLRRHVWRLPPSQSRQGLPNAEVARPLTAPSAFHASTSSKTEETTAKTQRARRREARRYLGSENAGPRLPSHVLRLRWSLHSPANPDRGLSKRSRTQISRLRVLRVFAVQFSRSRLGSKILVSSSVAHRIAMTPRAS